MDELKIKNETVQHLNISSCEINKIITKLEVLYSKEYSNIANIYRNKMYELEDIFKSNQLSFYNNILGEIILNHLDNMLKEGCDLINDISQNISDPDDSYLVFKVMLFLNKMSVSDYEKLCFQFSSFSLQNNIEKVLINYFKSSVFYLYRPGEFINKYEEIKQILVKLNINVFDKDILKIIRKKEQEILYLYELAKSEINSNNEDDIQSYISTMVEQFKKEIKGKQKKRI